MGTKAKTKMTKKKTKMMKKTKMTRMRKRRRRGRKKQKKKKKKPSYWRATSRTVINDKDGFGVRATLLLDMGHDIWIVGLVDHGMLEMVKIRITGPTTYRWIATKHTKEYSNACTKLKTFTYDLCFKGESVKNIYPVVLRALKAPKLKKVSR